MDEDKVVLNYKGMKGLPQETLGGVVANLQKRLGLWYTEVVSKFTAEDEMEFDNFTKPNSKEAIFVIYPIGSTTFKPIISMFYQQFISRMKYMASQNAAAVCQSCLILKPMKFVRFQNSNAERRYSDNSFSRNENDIRVPVTYSARS